MLQRFKIYYLLFLFTFNLFSESLAVYSDHQQCLLYSYQNNYSHIENARIDIGWLEYLNLVYGSTSSSIVNQEDFQFYYTNNNIRLLSLSGVKSRSFFPSSTFVHKLDEIKQFVASYQWVEVMRFHVNKLFDGFPTEGFTAPNWTRQAYQYRSSVKVPYGCWFYFAPGSGIYINIGNTLVVDKHKVRSENFAGYLNLYGCISTDNAKNCYDKYYCSAAISKGSNILFNHSH